MHHSDPHPSPPARHWWHSATVYQIYPASFKDSNADGFGDIQGIIEKVEYIASLGVDAVWLSPCYKSQYVDMGYDISDYRQIDQRFGTVEDIERLIARLAECNMKLLMDLVINHTSDQHAWFQESRSSLDSPKRDWYIWRKGKSVTLPDGTIVQKPPNNWESQFKGSAWQYDEITNEWYLRLFAKEQPDLNWDNRDVREAVYGDMRFWLDKGIGGFRMDVINMISKPNGLPDAPVTNPRSEYQPAASLYCNGPHIHGYIREMRQEVLDEYEDVMTVGEVPFTFDPAEVRKYVEPERKELCMLFQFDLFGIDMGSGGKFTPSDWQLKDLKSTISKWQQLLSFTSGAWQTVFLESHDAARSVSRFGDRGQDNRFRVAKMLAMLETTLAGTLFMHQGQEIGMANLAEDIPIEEYMDIETKGFLHDLRQLRQAAEPDRVIELKEIVDEVADQVRLKARDHGRMPMPWDGNKPNAGFSEARDGIRPWTRVNSDFDLCNVAHQEKFTHSVLKFWQRMLAFRRQHAETLVFGDFEPVALDNGPVFAYHRTPLAGSVNKSNNILAILNMTSNSNTVFRMPTSTRGDVVELSLLECSRSKNGHSCAGQTYTTGEEVLLRAYEGLVLAY
ncbi:hypothetical protein LTR37_009626 [Vermiconidia calcicola]|uniref:Uncharacterized protein n=1 Tax=Vermiconidia calcicola TaxID=1690605 RepID=A0ACC3N8G4_9PEZI|nr:hypothetical protein LTR37_009626 [Vermiconidia calcicola]